MVNSAATETNTGNIVSIKSFLAAGYKISKKKKFSLTLHLYKEKIVNKIEKKIQILK